MLQWHTSPFARRIDEDSIISKNGWFWFRRLILKITSLDFPGPARSPFSRLSRLRLSLLLPPLSLLLLMLRAYEKKFTSNFSDLILKRSLALLIYHHDIKGSKHHESWKKRKKFRWMRKLCGRIKPQFAVTTNLLVYNAFKLRVTRKIKSLLPLVPGPTASMQWQTQAMIHRSSKDCWLTPMRQPGLQATSANWKHCNVSMTRWNSMKGQPGQQISIQNRKHWSVKIYHTQVYWRSQTTPRAGVGCGPTNKRFKKENIHRKPEQHHLICKWWSKVSAVLYEKAKTFFKKTQNGDIIPSFSRSGSGLHLKRKYCCAAKRPCWVPNDRRL